MPSKKNRTHTTRAARALAAHSHLSYQAALTLVRRAPDAPRPEAFDDPEFVAAFIAKHQPTPAVPAARERLTGCRFGIELDDDIGHTLDTWGWEDLHDDMRAAVEADPDATSWKSHDAGRRWTLKALPAGTGDIVWADDDGEFVLSDGTHGNPGCDECGTHDAAARVDGTYLCAGGLARRGIGWDCDECGQRICSPGAQSDQHTPGCSLHPANEAAHADHATGEDGDEVERCARCGADLADDEGEGYDGYCGSCADVIERTCAVCGGDMVDVATPCLDCGGHGWDAEPHPSTGEPINPRPCRSCDGLGALIVATATAHDPDAPSPAGWEHMDSHGLDENHTPHNVWE